jgi:hypothetical protein
MNNGKAVSVRSVMAAHGSRIMPGTVVQRDATTQVQIRAPLAATVGAVAATVSSCNFSVGATNSGLSAGAADAVPDPFAGLAAVIKLKSVLCFRGAEEFLQGTPVP